MSRMTSRRFGAFSQRDMVGREHRSSPLSGNRPQASLKAGSKRSRLRSLDPPLREGVRKSAGRKIGGGGVKKPRGTRGISDHRRKLLGDRGPPFGLRENQHHVHEVGVTSAHN